MNQADQTITRYLLGEVSEAEQSALEERYFNDRHFFDQVVAAENELVDRYARGLLSPETRDRFERYYLSHPKRRERARFAAALAVKVDQINRGTPVPSLGAGSWWDRLLTLIGGPKLAWAFSITLLLLTVGLVWFLVESRRLHQELAKTESESVTQGQRGRELEEQVANERQRSQQLTAELDRLRAQRPTGQPSPNPQANFVSLVLAVGGVRGADTGPPASLLIPVGTNEVRIQLRLKDSDYLSYQAVLQPAGGRPIFSRQSLRPRANDSGASVVFVIPANKFATGDYILTLKGVTQSGDLEDINKSLFRVEKK